MSDSIALLGRWSYLVLVLFFIVLGCVAADMIPWCFRPYIQMHFYFNAWIFIYGSQRNSMDIPIVVAAERGATSTAKIETPSIDWAVLA